MMISFLKLISDCSVEFQYYKNKSIKQQFYHNDDTPSMGGFCRLNSANTLVMPPKTIAPFGNLADHCVQLPFGSMVIMKSSSPSSRNINSRHLRGCGYSTADWRLFFAISNVAAILSFLLNLRILFYVA